MALAIGQIIAMDTEKFLASYYFGNPVKDYLTAIVIFILLTIVFKIFKFVIVGRLKKVAERTKTKIDDLIIKVIDSIRWPFYVILALYIAMQSLALPDIARRIVFFVLMIDAVYYGVKAVQRIIEFWAEDTARRRLKEEKDADTSVIDLITIILKIFVWVTAFFLVLSNLGIDVTPLIAGLGIGGIAIAFALQNVLKDILASFSIYFDKPFRKGDFIIIGTDMGTVKKIGIKSTRIETAEGDEMVIPNTTLVETRLRNQRQMRKRVSVLKFGVKYETSKEKLEKIPKILKKIIDGIQLASFERAHFKDFGESSLNFEAVFSVNAMDYEKYMDIRQKINLSLKEEFEKEGIEFAYPTQTVYLNKEQ